MIITHDLLKRQKPRKRNLKVNIDLYPYATELYDELGRIGIIDRIKEIPQLGTIKVNKQLLKTRYDYILLQLYLHQLIKNNLQSQLRLTYNNVVKSKEFRDNYSYNGSKDKPTIGDVMQLLTIVYNIGHFYNTFTASRAVIMAAKQDEEFKNYILNASENTRYRETATKLLESHNYQRMHLLNSLLILEHCNTSLQSVSLATEILYAYINENDYSIDSKLRFAFSVFRSVRTVSYIAYDLHIADTPLSIDICDTDAMLLLFGELLSEYNNSLSSTQLVASISKLLDDTVYNETSNAICYYRISRRMTLLLRNDIFQGNNYYDNHFLQKESIFNKQYSHIRDYTQSQILKLTFSEEHRHLSENLIFDLERINNTRIGYYDRHNGEQTVLVSIKRKCSNDTKIKAAFHVLKCSIGVLRQIDDISPSDVRYLLCAKFFLFYLFNENPVIIKPTINDKICVLGTRGKNVRIKEIEKLIKAYNGDEDTRHETDFMVECLRQDRKNDTSITIPGSIIVFQKEAVGRKLCEFDGMIIHPQRKEKQVVFLEAKNTQDKPAFGKKCLIEKFRSLGFQFDVDKIESINKDAKMEYSIKK